MEKFVVHSIQEEHGDLNEAQSRELWPNENWPALSPLGTVLKQQMEGDSYDSINLVKFIVSGADGNVGLANLLLKAVQFADSMEETKVPVDMICPILTSIFDSGINAIESKGQHHDTYQLAISAMKLATEVYPHWGMNYLAIKAKLKMLPTFNLQELLYAAKGFLSIRPIEDETLIEEYGEDSMVRAFNDNFALYASQRYNKIFIT
jgi:hypothetical protein